MIESTSALPAAERDVRLDEQVLLLTGATGGLGEALARVVSAAGGQLILAAKQVVKLERLADALTAAGGPEPILYPVDLSGASAGDYAEMAAAIGRECGRLDAVVHAAASFRGLSPLVHAGFEGYAASVMVNLHAPMLINQSLHTLLRTGGGRVVHVLDDLERVGRAYWGAYGVSQFGLRGLLAVLGDEYEEDGICLCGFLPGPMRTRLRASVWVSEEDRAAADPALAAGDLLRLLDPAFAPRPGAVYRRPEAP